MSRCRINKFYGLKGARLGVNFLANYEVIFVPTENRENGSNKNRNESVAEDNPNRLSSEAPPPPLNNDDDDEGSTCSICLDAWEMQGDHRLVSLKCGHLFGDSCIRRWIQECPTESKCCPTCKKKAKVQHLRTLFARRVVVADKSKEHHLQKLLDTANKRNVYLETKLREKYVKPEECTVLS